MRAGPAFRRPLAQLSSHIFSWDSRFLSLTASTGQVPSVTTAVASANLIATDGTTLAAVLGMPRWQALDLDAGIAGRESPSLWLGTGDTVAWDVAPRLTEGLTLAVRFIQPVTHPAVGTGLLFLGRDDGAGFALSIESDGIAYRIVHWNDFTTNVVSSGTVTPTAGQVVLLRGVLFPDGSVRLHQSLDGGTETSGGISAPKALLPVSDSTRIRLNGQGAQSFTSFGALRAWLSPGTAWTPATLERF